MPTKIFKESQNDLFLSLTLIGNGVVSQRTLILIITELLTLLEVTNGVISRQVQSV
jgi:hypothetical protein